MMRHDLILVALGAVVTALLVGLVMYLSRPHHVVETAKPAVIQPDGSHLLERTDTQPNAKPAHEMPRGATLERVVQIKVKNRSTNCFAGYSTNKQDSLSLFDTTKLVYSGRGNPIHNGPVVDSEPSKPIQIDLSLIREKDDTRRVIASSPDGEIVGGIDIPVDTPSTKPRVWAAGISLDPIHQTPGVWIERDLMRLRIGVEANQVRAKSGDKNYELRIKAGMTW